MNRPTSFHWVLTVGLLCLVSCSGSPPDDHADHDEHASSVDEQHEEGVVQLAAQMLERVQIRTAEVSERTLPAELVTTGQVDFQQDRLAHVTPRIPGRVESVTADLGDQIEANQSLAVIDSIELGQAKAALLEAKAREELARQNLNREEGLYTERISSEKENQKFMVPIHCPTLIRDSWQQLNKEVMNSQLYKAMLSMY